MDNFDREERELRAAVMALATVKQCRRFEGALAARIVAHTERRLARGETIAAVCTALDMSHQTLSRLVGRQRAPAPQSSCHVLRSNAQLGNA